MSILDGMPKSQEEVLEGWKVAARFLQPSLKDLKLTDRQKTIFDLMGQGMSLADIYGITKEERDAVLAQGCQLLQVGETAKAQDVLLSLLRIEPTDERTIYALAATYQAQGDYATAGKMYVNFIALDATNPEGHLRLAECFMGAKEFGNARESFEIALGEAEAGNGRPGLADYARKMIAHVREQERGAGAKSPN